MEAGRGARDAKHNGDNGVHSGRTWCLLRSAVVGDGCRAGGSSSSMQRLGPRTNGLNRR